MRKIVLMFMLALFLLCGFSAQAEDGIIYPQPVQITMEQTGAYSLSFEGSLELNERWVWFACPDEDSAEDLMGVMRDALADETPARGLTFDYVFQTWPIHGTTSLPTVKIPAGSGCVFYGKAYWGAPGFDPDKELYMISLGGTNLRNMKTGEIAGNDLMDGFILPPATGDPTHPFLFAFLLAASSLGIILLIKRGKKIRAGR